MLLPKIRQLILNIVTINQNIFLKFSPVILLLFLVACKSDTAEKASTSDKKADKTEKAQTTRSKKIVFFGDSLTAGLGLEDVNDAFPGIIQDKIDDLKLDYSIVNSGVSGETTSGGRNRIDWVLKEEPTIFILELGANDGLRGVPLEQTKENLQAIIDAVKGRYPSTKIILAGMQLPPNMGQAYTKEFKNLFASLAKKNNLYLIPFLLDNVGGIPALNQADGIHPTKEGHKILATNVWNVLKPILK